MLETVTQIIALAASVCTVIQFVRRCVKRNNKHLEYEAASRQFLAPACP